LDSGLQQDSPMTKLQITAMVAGLTAFASVCVCWLLGKDPLGECQAACSLGGCTCSSGSHNTVTGAAAAAAAI
jgi:hypothetical protein